MKTMLNSGFIIGALALCSSAFCLAADASAPTPAKQKEIVYPADVLGGLDRWHLTLPVSKDKKPFPADSIERGDVNTYSGPYFKLNEDKTGVVMTSLFGGSTTSGGTAFARSELREYDANGNKADWDCRTAERAMTIRERILKTPTHKPEMSIGQIHDAKSDNLELTYHGPHDANGTTDTGTILAKFNGESTSKAGILDENYKIGDMIVATISTKDGVIKVDYYNERSGVRSSASKAFTEVKGGCYFKAGNYHQACTKQNIYGETNVSCSKKSYAPEAFEVDPFGTSIIEIHALSLDK